MYPQTLPPKTAKLLEELANRPLLKNFYLSGGTALALEIGHRESEDLDFFTKENFDPLALQRELLAFGNLENVEIADGTLNLFLNGVKLQFLHYPYQLLEDFADWNGVSLSSELDIACTKLITISMRGSKKDFIDLYFILKDFNLTDLIEKLSSKYSGTEYNQAHILKSLAYFDDAEPQPMPRMHINVSWEQVKETIANATRVVQF